MIFKSRDAVCNVGISLIIVYIILYISSKVKVLILSGIGVAIKRKIICKKRRVVLKYGYEYFRNQGAYP